MHYPGFPLLLSLVAIAAPGCSDRPGPKGQTAKNQLKPSEPEPTLPDAKLERVYNESTAYKRGGICKEAEAHKPGISVASRGQDPRPVAFEPIVGTEREAEAIIYWTLGDDFATPPDADLMAPVSFPASVVKTEEGTRIKVVDPDASGTWNHGADGRINDVSWGVTRYKFDSTPGQAISLLLGIVYRDLGPTEAQVLPGGPVGVGAKWTTSIEHEHGVVVTEYQVTHLDSKRLTLDLKRLSCTRDMPLWTSNPGCMQGSGWIGTKLNEELARGRLSFELKGLPLPIGKVVSVSHSVRAECGEDRSAKGTAGSELRWAAGSELRWTNGTTAESQEQEKKNH